MRIGARMRVALAFLVPLTTIVRMSYGGYVEGPVSPSATVVPSGFGTAATHAVTDLGSCLRTPAAACFLVASSTLSSNAAIDAPLNLQASVLSSTVTLNWTAPSGAVSYTIEAGTATGLADLANFPTGNALTTFTATAVPAGVYYLRVRALNTLLAVSQPSNEVIVIVGSCQPPAPPTGLTLTTNVGGSVGLRWNGVAGAATYVLDAGSLPGLSNLASLNVGLATTFNATGIGPGTYFVRVRVTNACGSSGPSNEVTIVIVGGSCQPPAPPTGLTLTTNVGGSVGLRWDGVAGAAAYMLDAGSLPGLSNLASLNVGLATTFNATGIGPGTYFVRVRVTNACGPSGPSNEVTIVVTSINDTTSYRHQNSLAPTDIGSLLVSNGFGGYYFDARQYIDLDGDGVQEIVVAAGLDTPGPSGPILVFKREANGTYSNATSSYFGSVPALVHPRKAIAADFNGDGLPDLYFADHGYDHPPYPGAQNVLLLSDKNSGKWAQKAIAGNLTAFSHCATAGDVDNNGTIDIFACGETPVMPTESNPVRAHFLLNDGTGNMTVAGNIIPINVGGPMGGLLAAELVDVDDDGYLDLVAGYQGASSGRAVIIFWGNGTLPFSATRATQVPDPIPNPPAFPNTYDIKAEDINGDGRRDLVLLRVTSELSGYYFQILLQTEPRSFVDESLVRIIGAPSSWEGNTGAWFPWIHMPDLNGDGFVDLGIGDSGAFQVARHLQWLNDRRGFFSKVP